MSTFSNTMKQDVSTRSIFPNARALIDSTITFTQGDLLYLDTTNHLIKKITAEAQSATFLGVAPVSVTLGKYASAYTTDVDASAAIPAIPGPQYGSTFDCLLKAGDTIHPGDLVYADPATAGNGVTVTAGTESVGVYQGKTLTAASGGTHIEVLINQCYVPGV